MMDLSEQFSLDSSETRAERRARERRRKYRRRRMTAIVILVALVLGGGALIGIITTKNSAGSFFASNGDFTGEGREELTVDIAPGSSAKQVANMLVEKGVIKAAGPFLREIESRGVVIRAGTFTMRKEMSSKAAVDLLADADAAHKVTIAEGFTLKKIKAKLKDRGFSDSEINAAIDGKTPADYGLDVKAPSLEGYLAPATYEVHSDTTVKALVRSMVNGTKTMLNELAITHDDAHYFLTLASLVEIESTGDPEVRAKVARVFKNRLAENSETRGFLQSDATVAYIFGARKDLTTTAEQRKSKNPYNTYVHKGLPPGPINSPSVGAVQAAKRPAVGRWQYFVATNPDTGEVKFAETYAEHAENVKEYQEWLRQHRQGNG